jgi:HAD superfamily hydrolase (TIGR01662 family)
MKVWVFDLDGTLVDSFSHYFVLLDEIFREHGARFSSELCQPALTQPLPEFFEQHLGKEAVGPAMSVLQEKSNADAERIRPFEGLPAALRHLAEQGARIAVWTNRDRVSAELILEHSGLKPYAQAFVSGSCVNQRKPHPEGLLRIIDTFGCKPSDVTMVGDHEHDVTAAKSAGARAVRASWHSHWVVDPCTVADAQFHHVSDFSEWVGLPRR